MSFKSNNNDNSMSNHQSQHQRNNNSVDRFSANSFDNSNNQPKRPKRGYAHTPNKALQVNSSRFSRETPQQTYGDIDQSADNESEFPNDWVKRYKSTSQPQPVHYKVDHKKWKATKPFPRYHTRSNGTSYPDRKGIPQIATKGKIEDITRDGCQFVVHHYKQNSSLLPSTITLMQFKEDHDQSGTQARLHYSWMNFFKILWINAKQNTGLGIEIPETGWKLSAIEKFEDSLKKNVAGPLAIALYKYQIDKSSQYFKDLMGCFCKLSPGFLNYLSQKEDEVNNQDVTSSNQDHQQLGNNNDDTKDEEATGGGDEKIDDGLKRNAREAMKYFEDNNFSLSNEEPRFIKKIDGTLETYLTTEGPQELSKCFEMAKQLSQITDYEFRIHLVLDDGDPYLAMEPISKRGNNPFEIYTDLKQILANDQEGDDTKEDVKLKFVQSYFHKMEKVYKDWKKSAFELFEDDNDWIKHKHLLQKLHFKISKVHYIDQPKGPAERGSIFGGNWMKCCVEYNYPGKEILDEINFHDKATTFDGGDDFKHNDHDQSTADDGTQENDDVEGSTHDNGDHVDEEMNTLVGDTKALIDESDQDTNKAD